ncbi:MAG: ribokinase [bacterium]|nr:ribokinase [bacterium]MDE0290679.1 ribokinase [bacterium]MDE0437950.1 ribokinase [bacterium]
MATHHGPPTVVVVGSTNIDLVAYLSRVPRSGETLVGRRFQMGFGGKGANQAVMARLLGAEVVMVNCLGDDTYGDMTLDNFAGFGIDTANVYRVPGASGVAPIWVEPDGSNRIIIIPGANHELTGDQAARSVRRTPDAGAVVGQFEIPQEVTAAAFAAAREQGATTVLNPAPAAALSSGLLELTDWLIPNEVEFETLSGGSPDSDRALVAFAEETATRLVVTLGEDGAAVVSAGFDRVERLPSPGVDPVDTTGAGDAFVGAFVFGLASGLGERAAVRLGNACAADSVTRPGTQSSFPRSERIEQLLAEIRGSSV